MDGIGIRGEISTGKGEGAAFVSLPWVKKQIVEAFGFSPYDGTLNMKLKEAESTKLRNALCKAKAIDIAPVAGFSSGKCFRALLNDRLKCAVVIPEIASYPKDVVELVAPSNLRENLRLIDGDFVEIRIVL